jgi:hypothetical protein
MTVSDEPVILRAYVDEAGARGLVRDLAPGRDEEFGLLCAVVFPPEDHDSCIAQFTPAFEAFRDAMPPGEKPHITDAFSPGNEAWGTVAEAVREEYLNLILTTRPLVIYSARRLKLERESHQRVDQLLNTARVARRSQVKIVGENRPSDARVEDTLIECLALRLDAFADDVSRQLRVIKQVDLLFDEIDLARRYEAKIQRTREVSRNVRTVKGWVAAQSKRVEGSLEFSVNAAFRIDTKFIGGIHVVGKDHPLVFAADIVANHLAHQLGKLPPDAPLNAPSSVAGWVLESRVWGVMVNATDDQSL